MKNKIGILFLFSSLVLFLFPTHCLTYQVEAEGKKGHESLSDNAIQLKKTVNPGLGAELTGMIQDKIKKADSAEDKDPQWMRHFYNPLTGKGLPFYENAKQRAKKFYDSAVKSYCSGNKQSGWDNLGHALHLLQDMGSPSHVHNATHAFQQFFPTWGFENYVSNNWGSLASLIVAEDCELGNIGSYMENMSLTTFTYYPRYDSETVISSPQYPLPPIYIPIPVTTGEDPYTTAPFTTKYLLNKVVCYSAGLIDTFWNDVQTCSQKPPQPDPGGDHPDETYDVSVPLAYDIDAAAYQSINMRLAMKKGRPGYYWGYLYGNKFQEALSLPQGTPNDVIAQKFIELKDIENLLNNYPYNETDDTQAAPDVAILSNGYAEDIVKLLFKEKETAKLIEPQFSIYNLNNLILVFIN